MKIYTTLSLVACQVSGQVSIDHTPTRTLANFYHCDHFPQIIPIFPSPPLPSSPLKNNQLSPETYPILRVLIKISWRFKIYTTRHRVINKTCLQFNMLEICNSLVRISLLLELIVEKLFLLNVKVSSSSNLYSIEKKRNDSISFYESNNIFFHVETREFSKQMITRRSVRVHKKITYTCELSTELVGKSISINASRNSYRRWSRRGEGRALLLALRLITVCTDSRACRWGKQAFDKPCAPWKLISTVD